MTVWRRPSLLLNQLRRIRDTQPPPLLLQLQLVRQARPRTLQSDFSVASTRHRIAQLPANDSDRGWGNLDEGPGPPAHMAKYKYYAVARGRVPGVYSTWAECETQVKAVSAAFKGFNDRREAEAFVLGGGETSIGSRGDKGAAGKPVPIRSAKRKTVDDDASAPAIIGAGSHKSKAVRANGAARAKDADVGLPAASARRSAGDHGGTRVIEAYTDGAAAGNGQVGSRAGWGVHWPEGAQDPTSDVAGLDESARLPGSLQTNNRAELMAIIRACQLCPDPAAQLRIYTDSRYSIQAMTEWQHNWRRNKWMRGTGSQRSAVMNKDLIRRLERELRARTLRPELVYVKGHASSVGNNEADRLAVAGAALPDVPESEWPTDLEPSDSSDDGHCGVGGNGSGSGAAGHGEKQVRERERARVLWEKAGFSREQASKRVESAIGIGSNSDGSGGSGGSVRYGNGDPASVNGVGRGK